MRLSTSPSFVYALGIGLFVFGACLPATASADDVVIGVISPLDGRPVGRAHEASVRLAFETLGTSISSSNGNALAMLKLAYVSDNGDPQIAVQQAQALAAADAIAIIGPADTRSTQAVLNAKLNIPVISALSTATSLTKPNRDKWFFRVTLNDSARMRQYVEALRKPTRRTISGQAEQVPLDDAPYVLYDDMSPYGTGLEEDLIAALQPTRAVIVPWSKMNVSSIAMGQPAPANIFILGLSKTALQHARNIDLGLRAAGGHARYLFVGDDGDLRENAPPGSVTIGEPTILDFTDSSFVALRNDYAGVLRTDYQESTDSSERDADGFLVTAYEAAYVLHQAIRMIVDANEHEPHGLKSRTKDELREALRKTLESESFEALEPWRTIKFENGETQGPPQLAVYESKATFELYDIPTPHAFVEVKAPETAGYLQGPITVRLIPHQTNKIPTITVVRNRGVADPKQVHAEPGKDKNGVDTVTFHAMLPGTYELSADPMLMKPAELAVEVWPSTAYAFALFGAVLGSALFIFTAPTLDRESVRRFFLGVITGCAIAALYFYRESVPGGTNLPSLGDTETAAAFWDGVAGGWIGPGLLVLVVARLLGLFGGGSAPKGGSSAPGTGPAPPATGAPPAPST